MIKHDLRLQKPLEDYIEYIEKLCRRSTALLGDMSAPQLSYQDPYHNVQGAIEVEQLFEHRLKTYPNGRYKISDFMWGRRDGVAYIYWSFRYQAEKRIGRSPPDKLMMEGMSELKFLPDGKIYSISEFWGEHSNFDIKAYKRHPTIK